MELEIDIRLRNSINNYYNYFLSRYYIGNIRRRLFPIEKYERYELEKLRVNLVEAIPDYLFDSKVLIVADNMLARIQGYIWSERVGHNEIKYPLDWFQAFKERWFPVWVKKKYPIKYQYYRFNLKAIYPKLRISLPKESHVMRLEMVRNG